MRKVHQVKRTAKQWPSYLVTIDPGNEAAAGRVCYCADWVHGVLAGVRELGYAAAVRESREDGPSPVVVVEKPQMDARSREIPPKVLIDLAWNGALVAAALRPSSIVTVAPAAWTTIPKPVMHLRIWRTLTPSEKSLFPADTFVVLQDAARHYARTRRAKKHAHYNTLDAVGIGLFHLGRMKKSGGTP